MPRCICKSRHVKNSTGSVYLLGFESATATLEEGAVHETTGMQEAPVLMIDTGVAFFADCLHGTLHAFPFLPDTFSSATKPCVMAVKNKISALESAEAALLSMQQLIMQQSGGQGLQSAGLQLAWAFVSEIAKPPSKIRIMNTFFIAIRLNG